MTTVATKAAQVGSINTESGDEVKDNVSTNNNICKKLINSSYDENTNSIMVEVVLGTMVVFMKTGIMFNNISRVKIKTKQ